eukprot:9500700-Pyramimonas_sp.AAC.1
MDDNGPQDVPTPGDDIQNRYSLTGYYRERARRSAGQSQRSRGVFRLVVAQRRAPAPPGRHSSVATEQQ